MRGQVAMGKSHLGSAASVAGPPQQKESPRCANNEGQEVSNTNLRQKAASHMTATIRIAPGQFADSAALIHSSALEDCTRIDGDDAGIFVERRWPSLSTGEELLWSLLSWLNGVGEQPSVVALVDGLDSANLLAAMDAVDAGRGVSA